MHAHNSFGGSIHFYLAIVWVWVWVCIRSTQFVFHRCPLWTSMANNLYILMFNKIMVIGLREGFRHHSERVCVCWLCRTFNKQHTHTNKVDIGCKQIWSHISLKNATKRHEQQKQTKKKLMKTRETIRVFAYTNALWHRIGIRASSSSLPLPSHIVVVVVIRVHTIFSLKW